MGVGHLALDECPRRAYGPRSWAAGVGPAGGPSAGPGARAEREGDRARLVDPRPPPIVA